jgi:hypothetical protein
MRLLPGSDRGRRLVAIGVAVAVVVPLAWMWWDSRLPDSYDPAQMGYVDYGGGPLPAAPQHAHHHGVAVADLVETTSGPPDRRSPGR